MNGWLQGWMDECIGWWVDGWVGEWMGGWLDECMDGWVGRQVDGWRVALPQSTPVSPLQQKSFLKKQASQHI